MKSASSYGARVSGVLTVLLIVLLFLPVFRWLAGEWLHNEYYSHGPLTLLISVFFSWRILSRQPKTPDNRGLILFGIGIVLYLAALYYRAFYVAALLMIIVLSGIVWTFWGKDGLRRMAFPLLFLIFMIPLPFVEASSLPLSLLTGGISTKLMQSLGMDVSVQGAAISLPSVDLVVGAQCSGVRSIISLFTLYTLFVYIVDGSWARKLFLLLLSIPAAMAGNVLRVSSLLLVANQWGADAGFDYYHKYSGFVFFFFVGVLLLLMAKLLKCNQIRADI